MNFLKSILSDDQDHPKPENSHQPDPDSPISPPRDDNDSKDVANGWSFGGLIKTLAIESVIDTYRRDLQEFGSGLKKETDILRETASRAVKDLPASLEASASAAQGALDGVLKSTAEIISKDSLGFASDGESQTPGTNWSLNSARYSWYDAQLSAIQSDSSTFCEDPEDAEEYRKWKLGFHLEKNRDEIDSLIGEHGILEDVYERFVPIAVDHETFWSRYFYRVDKLKQQESVRANLVKRAISVDDDEELSWDVDDDDEIDGNLKPGGNREGLNSGSQDDKEGDNVEKSNVVESSRNSNVGEKDVEFEMKSDEKSKSEECIKEKNAVSSHTSKTEEEDLEWDEIEDIGSGDEKKSLSGSPNRTDLRKRLSAVEDDEDLSWDIEDDDDEPVKA